MDTDTPNPYQGPTPAELRAILAALDVTQSEAGRLVGVRPRTVRKWISGEREPPAFAALYTLAHRARGVSITPAGWRQELAAALDAVAP